MSNQIPHIWKTVCREPWAIEESKLAEIIEVLRLKAEGADIGPYAAREKPEPSRQGAIAVLPVFGLLSKRANMMTDFSGGTSIQKLTSHFRQAVRDPEVASILLQVDSPGGGVFGVSEFADEIFKARGKKRIVALADDVAASAAYWIATAAEEFVMTPSAKAGSIGVFAVHEDASGLHEKVGIKHTIISAGKFKTEGNEFEPLTEEARAFMQSEVDRYYGMFILAVARNRGVKVADVLSGFGQGRALGAPQAVKEGMADWIGTFDDVIGEMATGKTRKSMIMAKDEILRGESPIASAKRILSTAEIEAREYWSKEVYADEPKSDG